MEIFVVGGAVRDVILGREPKDLDFVVVGSTPEEMIQKGFVQVGADFPVFLDSDGREFALARTERKVGVGHTGFQTEFDPTITLQDDLIRRDLTINALAVRAEDWEKFWETRDRSLVIDHVGGLNDIKNRILRHVSEAFGDDPLRVLRVARFAARMNFDIAPETMDMMARMVSSGELDHLTKERVWNEMAKAMSEPFPHGFFDTMARLGALQVVAGDAAHAFVNVDERLRPLIIEGVEKIQLWMALFFDKDEATVNAFVSHHRMPSDVVDAIRLSQSFFGAFNGGVDDIIKVCNRFRLWNDSDILVGLAKIVRELWIAPHRFDSLVSHVKLASQINFASLTEDERSRLSGPEIGEAITNKRREVIAKWFKSA